MSAVPVTTDQMWVGTGITALIDLVAGVGLPQPRGVGVRARAPARHLPPRPARVVRTRSRDLAFVALVFGLFEFAFYWSIILALGYRKMRRLSALEAPGRKGNAPASLEASGGDRR